MSRPDRYTDADSDKARLPEDLERTAYDADKEIYTYTSRSTGETYQGLPGNRYGKLYRSGTLPSSASGIKRDSFPERQMFADEPSAVSYVEEPEEDADIDVDLNSGSHTALLSEYKAEGTNAAEKNEATRNDARRKAATRTTASSTRLSPNHDTTRSSFSFADNDDDHKDAAHVNRASDSFDHDHNHNHARSHYYTDLDSDEGRLPSDLERTGYDADTQIYYYTSRTNGQSYSGLPGNRYGEIYPTDSQAWRDAIQRERDHVESMSAKPFYRRQDWILLTPFLLIVGVVLLSVVRWTGFAVHTGPPESATEIRCEEFLGEKMYVVQPGDTCWDISQRLGINVGDLTGGVLYRDGEKVDDDDRERLSIDCDRLKISERLCYLDPERVVGVGVGVDGGEEEPDVDHV